MFGGGEYWLIGQLQFLIPLILSLTVHEWAHAWTALKLGDDTASRLGRVTLDPFVHLDPLGTFVLPLLGVPFGWAKPVPISPGRFRRDVSLRSGLFLTAAAGPASNMCIAIGSAICLAVVARIAPESIVGPRSFRPLFEQVIGLNVLLAFFNLIPVPPLDGSRILDTVVPDRLRASWDQVATYSPIALVVLLIVPSFLGLQLYELPSQWASSFVSVLLP